MFSVRATILILIILMVPFLIRFKFGDSFEPYPAVLLPSGAGKTKVDSDEIRNWQTILLAQQENGNWSMVDEVDLLYPIVPNNHGYIFRRAFGLIEVQDPGDRLFFRVLLKLNILKSRNATEAEKEKTRNWLKERLKEQGLPDDVLKIVQKREIVSILTGEILNEDIIDEKVLYLD